MRELLADLRITLRGLRRRRGFAAIVILTLGIGIGATTAVFGVVHAVLLRPLPFRDPGRVLILGEFSRTSDARSVSPITFNDWEQRQTPFSDLAAFRYWETVNLEDSKGEPEAVALVGATANFFGTLGIRPALGRTFKDEQSALGGSEAVISHELWVRRYGSDPQVLGRTIRIRGTATTIVGVMPPIARALSIGWGDVWTCLYRYDLPQMRATRYRARYLTAIGRLRPTVSPEVAGTRMRTLQRQLWTEPLSVADGHEVWLRPLSDLLYGDIRLPLAAVAAGVTLLLIVSGANVATLLLVRIASRRREAATRRALGAGASGIARLLLLESAVLALAGTLIGLSLAGAVLPALTRLGGEIPGLADARLTPIAGVFALALSLACAAAATLAPLLDLRRLDLGTVLAEGSRGGTGHQTQRLQRRLVVLQIALASLLLAVGGLLVRSFGNLLRVDPGFQPASAASFDVFLPNSRYRNDAEFAQFFRELIRRLELDPGISAAGGLLYFPYRPKFWTSAVEVEGRTLPPGQEPRVNYNEISGSYFAAMGIPLVAGRLPLERELWEPRQAPVAVINQTMARLLFPAGDAIGRRFRSGDQGLWVEIIGVVGDVRQHRLDLPAEPEYYAPFAQSAFPFQTIVVRGRDASVAMHAVRQTLREIDPGIAIANLTPLHDYVRLHTRNRAFALWILAVLAALAVLLGVVGVYAVMSYSVTERRRELGIRGALGASPRRIRWQIVSEGVRLVAIGSLSGLLAAALAAPLTRRLLYGIGPLDPLTLASVPLSLGLAALLACWIPAYAASRIAVTEALKE